MSNAPFRLRITYPTRRAVLASYRLDGSTLSLFVPTEADVHLGAEVLLEVSFGDCSQQFTLSGRVTWRRTQARGVRLEPGLGIAFVGSEKFGPAQMLAFCAGRPLQLGTSQDPRVELSIPCQIEVGAHKIKAKVRDISNGGLFVASKALARLSPGREVKLTLEPGWFGWGGKVLQARVVWSGEKSGSSGFGARFVGAPGKVRPAIKKYLAKAS